jgi:hypothetical protein
MENGGVKWIVGGEEWMIVGISDALCGQVNTDGVQRGVFSL